MKKKYCIILIFCVILIIIAMILLNNKKPYAYAIIELRDTTYGEYLKEIYVEVNVLNAKNSVRHFAIPPLLGIDNLDKIRSKKVNSYEINNISSANAQAVSRVVFDMEGLTFEQIKECYYNHLIITKILTKKEHEIEFSFNIGELIIDKTSE